MNPEFERLTKEFGSELRWAMRRAGALGEGALEELRGILEEALERIRTEVFGPVKEREAEGEPERAAEDAGESARTTVDADHAESPADNARTGEREADSNEGPPGSARPAQ